MRIRKKLRNKKKAPQVKKRRLNSSLATLLSLHLSKPSAALSPSSERSLTSRCPRHPMADPRDSLSFNSLQAKRLRKLAMVLTDRISMEELLELTSPAVLVVPKVVLLLNAVVTSVEDQAVELLVRLTLSSLATSASRPKIGPSSSSSVDVEKLLK
jgi:hypothetical protein